MTLKEEIKWLLVTFALMPIFLLLFAICINLADIRFDLAILPMMKHQVVDFSYTWTDIFSLMLMYSCAFFLFISYKYIKYKLAIKK